MIFSCKKISREEMVRCAFGLNKTGHDVLVFLMEKNKAHTALQIAEGMGLNRTTVQKAIKSLAADGLVKRMQTNLPGGGYVFLYKVNDKKEIKERLKKATHGWYTEVEKTINDL